jgi:hypothetical protein
MLLFVDPHRDKADHRPRSKIRLSEGLRDWMKLIGVSNVASGPDWQQGVTPLGFSTSTLVVTSKVRHLPPDYNASAKTGIDFR